MEKSPDAFRTISEAAEELGVPQHVLRFWETRFPQIKPMKRAGGRRYYRPADVDLLKGICSLLYKEGYTIRGVQKILKDDGPSHVSGIGRGKVQARKRVEEVAALPVSPKAAASAPAPLPVQPYLPLGEVKVVVNRLGEDHAEMLRAALRDLGDARRLLDPSMAR
ncbi:MAG: MerR family transcriptional regulator [Aestuariivirga sp.]|uniref:MerR family transcriptional regulator n=1 Tax=Aestuariivirga sp. TaxID=2650926 RepID=UPI0038D03C51